MPEFDRVTVVDAEGKPAIDLVGETRSVAVVNVTERSIIRLDATGPAITMDAPQARGGVVLSGRDARLRLGALGQAGSAVIADAEDKKAISLDGAQHQIVLRDGREREVLRLSAAAGTLHCGADGQDGGVVVRDVRGRARVVINGGDGVLLIYSGDGAETFRLAGSSGSLTCGADGQDGEVVLRDGSGRQRIRIDGGTGTLTIQSSTGLPVFRLDSRDGKLHLRNWTIEAPDHVFAPGYPLRPLDELRAFIGEHRHLPDVPSGVQIGSEGIELGAFTMTLLRKIEELTLYVMSLERAIALLQARVDAANA
jgi:hypothetical protein